MGIPTVIGLVPRMMQRNFMYSFSHGSEIFSWSCNKKDIVAQSIAEAEFEAAVEQ